MNKRMDFADDTIKKPEIFWSEKYACPLYRVGDKTYVGLTGEYGGYFEEVDTTVITAAIWDSKPAGTCQNATAKPHHHKEG